MFFGAAALCFLLIWDALGENAIPTQEEMLEAPLLPILSIVTRDGTIPEEGDVPGILSIYETDGTVSVTPIEINLRGNTSRRFPKQSYRVKTVDDRGKKCNLSMAGLRADDDWILNPMYSDTSKIREAVSYWLWDQMNASGPAAASTRVSYAEVFLNGEYHGLYAVEERVDRKQVRGDRRQDVLYKVIANDAPSVEELVQCRDETVCRGIELVFSGSGVEEPWLPAADYMAFLQGQDAPGHGWLSITNTVDYGLWAMLTQARDCHFKNQFIHGVGTEAGYELYRIPWDVNHTLGDLWNGEAREENFTEYAFLSLTMDDVFKKCIAAGDGSFLRAVADRWQAMRAEAITEENILHYARTLHDFLYPAIERDTLRWPHCGMGEGNAANIRDIEAYLAYILPRMDAWAENLTNLSEETENSHGNNLDR